MSLASSNQATRSTSGIFTALIAGCVDVRAVVFGAVLVVVCGVVSAAVACTAGAGAGGELTVAEVGGSTDWADEECILGRCISSVVSSFSNRTPLAAARSVLFWRASSSLPSFPLSGPDFPPFSLSFRFFPFFFVPFPTFFFFFEPFFSP